MERCARVLDGAVTVLDGSAGVQAQTITVWRQANKFNLPSVFFVNKMDKRGANFEKTIDSIKRRLNMHNVVPVCSIFISDRCMENHRKCSKLTYISCKFLNHDITYR